MDESNYARFEEFKKSQSPVKLYNVSPTKTYTFFNRGSSVSALKKLNFDINENTYLTVAELHAKPIIGMLNIIGKINWTSSLRTVCVNQTMKNVREAELQDTKNSVIQISIWGELTETIIPDVSYIFENVATHVYNQQITITTTVDTLCTENWSKIYEYECNEKMKLFGAEVLSSKINKFLCCNNCNSQQKTEESDDDGIFTCINCKRKIKIFKCKNVCSIDITVDKEGKETILTLIPKDSEDPEDIEYKLLHMSSLVDFEYNSLKQITKISKH